MNPNIDTLPDIKDLAFDNAEGYFFKPAATPANPHGELQPFSSRRKRAANSLGMKMFSSLTDDDSRNMESKGVYDGMNQDAVILLWVCFQTPKKLSWAMRYTDSALDEMNDWADEMELSIGEKNNVEAITVFTQIVFDVINSQTEGGESKEEEEEENLGKSAPTPQPTKFSFPEPQDTESTKSDGKSQLQEATNT